jgi:hypothetical protein
MKASSMISSVEPITTPIAARLVTCRFSHITTEGMLPRNIAPKDSKKNRAWLTPLRHARTAMTSMSTCPAAAAGTTT